jgi:hypothetical protein
MFTNLKFKAGLIGIICLIIAPMNDSAFAVSARIAKQCEGLTAKAFPARELGNPAAGSAKGTGREEQAYFKKCVANKGKMPASPK